MTRLILAALLAAGLGGCFGSAPPVPRDHYYRLLVPAPTDRANGPLYPGVVAVEPFDADGLLRERPLLFSSSGRPYELQQHDYHYWTDPPTRLVQGQMVTYLRRIGLAKSVVTPDMRIQADFAVSGEIKRLERLLDGGPPRVVAEIDLALIGLADNAVIVIDSYAAERPAADDSVEASVTALNLALADIFDRFLADAARL